jgi:UDPglucose 6-dehydrogenase
MRNVAKTTPDLRLAEDAYDLADGADALVVCTEWNEFKQLDLERIKALMHQPNVVDGRNLYEPAAMAALGFRYKGVGRGKLDSELENDAS